MTVLREVKRRRLFMIGAMVRREMERTGLNAYEQAMARRGDVSLHERINRRAERAARK